MLFLLCGNVGRVERGHAIKQRLLRRLGPFDLTLITIGGVIGSGIFRTPAVVAQRAHLPGIILGCWLAGGLIALIGAFIFAELAARRPLDGGLYGYLRDAYHPLVAFLCGWALLLAWGTGANAAAAVLFAGYLGPLTGLTFEPRIVAVITLAALALINLLGVRQGGNWQNFIVLLKIAAIAALIVAGLSAHPHLQPANAVALARPGQLVAAIGVAMLPVLFTYSGFQTASFVTAEVIAPARTIPRGLVIGVGVVVTTYVLVNAAYLHALGAAGLAATAAPAADAMRVAVGSIGGRFVALAIALSTLGYLSTCMLAFPRIYFQMAADGLFFKQVARVSRLTHVPVVAILLQAAIASLIALSGSYEQIVNWVVAPQWLFIFLAAGAVFVFRRRDAGRARPLVSVPGHPVTTLLFIVVLLAIFACELAIYPRDTLYGTGVVATGVVAYYLRAAFQAFFINRRHD
jgi:basic amino acid/polyamine antiporter, APA family